MQRRNEKIERHTILLYICDAIIRHISTLCLSFLSWPVQWRVPWPLRLPKPLPARNTVVTAAFLVRATIHATGVAIRIHSPIRPRALVLLQSPMPATALIACVRLVVRSKSKKYKKCYIRNASLLYNQKRKYHSKHTPCSQGGQTVF